MQSQFVTQATTTGEFEEMLFGTTDPALIKLPEPPWPYYFAWRHLPNVGPNGYPYMLYLRQLPTALKRGLR